EQQSAGEIATDTQPVPETFEALAPEEAISAEPQHALAADSEDVSEIVDEPADEALAVAERQDGSQEVTDSIVGIAHEERDDDEPVEESTGAERAATESAEELAGDPWLFAEDQPAIAIALANEAIAENSQDPEDKTQTHLSAQPLSDAPSFGEPVWESREE